MLPRIVLIGTQPPKRGGISTHVNSLKKRLLQNGFKVTVLDVLNIAGDRAQDDNEVLSGKNPFKLIANIFRLAKRGFEIFHFHTSRRSYAYLTAVIFVKLLNKTVILSIHHGGFNEWLLASKWREKIYLPFFSLADKIIFMNLDDAEKFKEISSIQKDKIISIPPFIVEDEKYYRARYPVTQNDSKFLVTTMGGWRVFYLLENVIQACTNIVEECSVTIQLDIIAGTSEMNEAYKQKIKKMADKKATVNFHITITENKGNIIDYLVGQDVLVRSNITDSYGLCVAEALMVGTSAIATNVCPRPANTILYEPYDIERLTELLKGTLKESKNKKQKESLITRRDDSYYLLADLYNSF